MKTRLLTKKEGFLMVRMNKLTLLAVALDFLRKRQPAGISEENYKYR